MTDAGPSAWPRVPLVAGVGPSAWPRVPLVTGVGPSAALPRVPLMLAPAGGPGTPSRGSASLHRCLALGMVLIALAATLTLPLRAQDPASSADHPPGNVNELTLAGLQPGRSRIPDAVARWGAHWRHPSLDESDIYVWCDARRRLQIQLEAQGSARRVDVVTVERLLGAPPPDCTTTLPANLARTGRGVRLGDTAERLKAVYGKPFFVGPSSWHGREVNFIVFNFSWAGDDVPQILESSFDAGRLVKMTLSAHYY